MLNIHKRIVVDDENRPVAVQIDYDDWCKLEEVLQHHTFEKLTRDLNSLTGTLQWGEDAVGYQRRVREEWAR